MLHVRVTNLKLQGGKIYNEVTKVCNPVNVVISSVESVPGTLLSTTQLVKEVVALLVAHDALLNSLKEADDFSKTKKSILNEAKKASEDSAVDTPEDALDKEV